MVEIFIGWKNDLGQALFSELSRWA